MNSRSTSEIIPIGLGLDADTASTAELERDVFGRMRVLMRANPGLSAEALTQLMLDREGARELPDLLRYAAHQTFLRAARHVLAERRKEAAR